MPKWHQTTNCPKQTPENSKQISDQKQNQHLCHAGKTPCAISELAGGSNQFIGSLEIHRYTRLPNQPQKTRPSPKPGQTTKAKA